MVRGALILSLLFVTPLSCAKPPARAKFGPVGSDAGKVVSSKLPPAGTPQGVEKDPYREPEKLTLSPMEGADAQAKTFDLSKPVDLIWSSPHQIILAKNDGRSLTFDYSAKAWTAVHTSNLVTEFTAMADFQDAGFFGVATEGLTFRTEQGKVLRLKAPEGFDEKNIVGSNPGFVAFRKDKSVQAIIAKGEEAKLYPLEDAPANLSLVYPCNLHCLVWGYDGVRISIYFVNEGWKLLDQTIELPNGEDLARMAVRFRKENNPVAIESIIAQTSSGKLFVQVAAAAPKDQVAWADVLLLSQKYCVSCHLEDGYDKEATWTGLKTSIIERLKAAPGSKGAMPPIETKVGAEMSTLERSTMLGWIEKQTETDRGQIGGNETEKNNDISGELKRLSDAHCLSCHKDAKKENWWKSKRGDIIARIKAGSMPKGKPASGEVKVEFENAINGLK